jgi:HEAT repeat protein
VHAAAPGENAYAALYNPDNMAKARSTDAKLERLKTLRDAAPSPEVASELRKTIGDSSNHVIAAAAALIARFHFSELAAELASAFDGLMVDPIKTDKTCAGKTAIVDALNELDFQEPDVFLAGARHIQMEPAWGGARDTAASLRAGCAIALVRIGHRESLPVLVDLLADSERVVRLAAAQALAGSGTTAALLLLRLKARLGDKEADVTGECLTGLMRLEPQESAPFVAEFLESGDSSVAEAALLALGNSRRPEAFEILKTFWERRLRIDLRETALVAMALLRLPAATDFLLALLADAPESSALSALSALAVLSYDPCVREQTAAAVEKRDSEALRNAFMKMSQDRTKP